MTDYVLSQTSTQIQSAISKVLSVPGPKLGSAFYTDVRDYGAVGNGVADDTDEIQAAIDSMTGGGTVFFPAGTFNFTALTLDTNYVSLLGAGYGATGLNQTTTGNGITISGTTGNHIADMGITGTGSSSTGALVYILNTGSTKIDTVYIAHKAAGIQLEATTVLWDTKLKNFAIDDCGTGIQLGAISTLSQLPQDVFIQDGIIGSCGTGISINGASGIYVHDIDIVSPTNYAINIAPTTGLKTQACIFTHVLADTSAGSGIAIQGAGSSHFISFVNCWSASSVHYGFFINSALGNDIRIEGSTITNNGKNGVYIGAGSNVKILGNGIVNNSTATNNTYDSVYIAAAVSDFDVNNNTYGWKAGLSSNKPRYGVYLAAGASDHYYIAYNRGQGNQSGTVSDNGTGTNKTVTPNLA